MPVLALPPCSSFSCAPSIGRPQKAGSSRDKASPGLRVAACYPSPPMSDRPSPPPRAPQQKEKNTPSPKQHDPRQQHDRVLYEANERQQPPPTALQHQHQHPELRPSSSAESEQAQPSSQMGPFGYSPFGAHGSFNPGYAGPTLALQQSAPLTSPVPLRNTKTARRNKAHVASACVNCKRAHLSCDVQRPCTRCVTSGKEASCYDVQHKKRGRPRLRDVQDKPWLGEHSTPASESPASSEPGLAAAAARRPESYRSLRSTRRSFGTSAAPRQPASHFQSLSPSPFPLEGAVQHPGPEHSRPVSSFVTPMALLNLDLHIIKTNSAFNGLFGQPDMRGRELTGLVESHHVETLQRLRSELREERDAREPSYMPPIFGPRERDAVQDIEEDDLDRISHGYTDREFTWRFSSVFGQPQDVRVRVRLAKTTIFFVSLALPPFQHSQLQPPPGEQRQQRYPPFFATPAVPQRPSRASARAAPTPMAEYTYPSYGQASPLVASEPPSPYSSYFPHPSMAASQPPAAPTPSSYSYGQPPSGGFGYPRGSWSSAGSAETHGPAYEVSARRGPGQVIPESSWHNEPRSWQQPQQQYPYSAYARPRGEPQHMYDPGLQQEGLAPGVRRMSSDEQRSQGGSEGMQDEEPSKRRKLDIRDLV